MLGGSVWIALIRYIISLTGVIMLFSRMSAMRYDRKKTILCYACFGFFLIGGACVWYLIDWNSSVRASAFVMYLLFTVYSLFMSSDPILLSVYKLALTFYLLAVFLIGGIDISVLLFDGNVWADIITRVVLIAGMAYFIEKKIKDSIRGFGYYMESELDRFSAVVMIISILFGIGYILNPITLDQTPFRLFQILVNFFLTGSLQLLVFRLYLHIGKEKEYQREYQLIQMNHRLLERNIEILEESAEAGRRIRHDARHHNAVIAEYVRRGQNEELMTYLAEYEKGLGTYDARTICANTAIDNLLRAYIRKAKKEHIKVTLDVELGKEPEIPNIDMVAILANAYENAIFGCMEVQKHQSGRDCFIHLTLKKKKNKIVICCCNTCTMETELRHGKPKPEFTGGIGVMSITKTADKYGGKYDFENDNGIFVFRLILTIPSSDAGHL